MIKRMIMAAIVALGIGSSCNAHTQNDIPSVLPEQFAKEMKSDTTAVILDVRTPEEYSQGHLQDARLIDFKDSSNFDKAISELPKDKTYYVYCRSGRRSMSAAEKMKELGLRVVDMAGGIIAWEKDGLPVVK